MSSAASKKKTAPKKKASKKKSALEEKLAALPMKPGVYIFLGPKEKVLYVGKAKALRSRVRSYFQKSGDLDRRKTSMVRDIRDLQFIVTDTELEALALEANLIKQYKPKFNVILRDDKNYPYLKLTLNEEWPRLEVVRRVKKDGALYFGPYVPSSGMREALSFIRRNFGVRPCRYRLDRPMRPCIQYQMGRCPAPCAGLIGKDEYMKEVDDVAMFLKGQKGELLEELEDKMMAYSEEQRYEDAARIRDRIAALRRAWESQKVISPELGDIDVIGSRHDGGEAAFQVFFVRNGVMIGARDFFLRDIEGVPPEELEHSFIEMFYAKEIIPPPRVLVDVRPSEPAPLKEWLRDKRGSVVRIVVPRGGKERELLKMAQENARLHYETKKGTAGDAVLDQVGRRLSLARAPVSIGAFDVSNIGGAQAVGAFVWWQDGDFRKDRYRHMRIKSVEGADDYAMMRETISRTLKNLKEWPDLVVVDGGKGHLETARAALSEFKAAPEVVSLAKKPDRVFTLKSDEPIDVEDRSSSSLLLRRIRDEVHRFAISFHKKVRGKRLMESPLQSISGIGKKRRLELLKHFKSLEAMRKASTEELAAVPGMNMKAALALKEALEKTRPLPDTER
jgi:excinuclease ABC subunit C